MDSTLPRESQASAARRNQHLFSDHILDHRVPQHPQWEAGVEQAEAVLPWLWRRYARERKSLPDYRDTGLEGHWFRPILRKLGHVFAPEPTIPGVDVDARQPDYVFFPDHTARREAENAPDRATFSGKAIAVGRVTRWDAHLGKKRQGGGPEFEGQIPAWQIHQLRSAVDVDWAILSNGRVWRLVHKDTSHRLHTYYEVDLVRMLELAQVPTLLYFTLFFRQAAFRPDDQGRVFLNDVLCWSRAYGRELEEDLVENVHRALQRLMQGFLDHPSNRLSPGDLDDIYDNSLYLLYRLLFILCGESRGLLPLGYEQYRMNHSLGRIREEIAQMEIAPAPGPTLYWGQLKNLFQIVNGKYPKLNSALGVPRYNGGLFDPTRHPFLEEMAVGDRALVEVIDLLSRRETESGPEFVDYRTLSARHVGSIYEGLLSARPRYARQAMVAVRDNHGGRWIEAGEAPTGATVVERCKKGQVYLETDHGERRAAGSYDTPRAVVETIVQRALGPVVEDVRTSIQNLQGNQTGKDETAQVGERLVNAVLGLRILDPAMGSGRFLVEATDFLALALVTDPFVRRGGTSEDDLSYWKRRVVERAIYGVDKNPLAVELAKLSLWLATVASDRPLSFLDHHLACGDALIGAQVDDLGWAPPPVLDREARKQRALQKSGQINLFEHLLRQSLPRVMGRVLEIASKESKDYSTVQAKQAAARAAKELEAPFEAVADLWTSAYFENTFDRGEYEEALGVVSQPDLLLTLEAVQRAQQMSDEHRFFHWELAFPEAFYDESGQILGERAGFSAVIGNPPWRDVLSESGREYLQECGFEAMDEDVDDFRFFVERSLQLLSSGGFLGFIVPRKCMEDPVYGPLRAATSCSAKVCEIIDFGDFLHFAVDVSTCVLLLQADAVQKPYRCRYVSVPSGVVGEGAAEAQLWLHPRESDPWIPDESPSAKPDG